MSWPFPEYIRPLMRSVLYYQSRGLSESEIVETLTGPPHNHPRSWVDQAYPEAQRSRLFAENIEAFGAGQTLGQLWDRYWLPVFTQAYGRRPSPEETVWARSRPGNIVGVMAEITVEGVPGFRWTPTANVPWDATMEEIAQQMREWFVTGQRSPAPPGSVGSAVNSGAAVNVRLIGGVLVPRIDPTMTLGR